MEHKHKIQIIDGERQMNDNGNYLCECGATTFPGCKWSEPVKPEGVGEWELKIRNLIHDTDWSMIDLIHFISNLLLQEKAKLKGELMTLINREIAIAHTKDKGGKTSRLTSLAMKIDKL